MEKEKLIDDEHWNDFWRKKQEWEEASKFLTPSTHNGHNNYDSSSDS